MTAAPRTVLLLALMGLAALFAGWFINDKHWLATQLVFTAPPLVVWLNAGSVNGMPTITQPWCSSGTCIDSRVDSWPPCIEAVEVNTPAGLPDRVPLTHSAPSPSRKCLTGAAMLPKRVGLPSSRPWHSTRSCTLT